MLLFNMELWVGIAMGFDEILIFQRRSPLVSMALKSIFNLKQEIVRFIIDETCRQIICWKTNRLSFDRQKPYIFQS